jgi:hypothetical protein
MAYIKNYKDLDLLEEKNAEKSFHIIGKQRIDNHDFLFIVFSSDGNIHRTYHILAPPDALWHYSGLKLCNKFISFNWGESGFITYGNEWISSKANPNKIINCKEPYVLGPGISCPTRQRAARAFYNEIEKLKKQTQPQNKTTQIEIKGLDDLVQRLDLLTNDVKEIATALQKQQQDIQQIQPIEINKTKERHSFMEAFKNTAKAAKIASLRGAKVASSKQIADLMVAGTEKALGDKYPPWLKNTEIGQTVSPFVISFTAHLISEMYPEHVPKAELVKAVASYAMEGTSNQAMTAIVSQLKPAMANFAELAKKIPLEDLEEEQETRLLGANRELTSKDIKAEMKALQQMKQELEQREALLVRKSKEESNS